MLPRYRGRNIPFLATGCQISGYFNSLLETEAMKTREQIFDLFFTTLSVKMNHANLAEFNSDAHLIDDLAIESSQLLELLMHMELDHELEIPEESLMNSDFETVKNIIELMFNSQSAAKPVKGREICEKPNIDSIASCLSEIVKRINNLDHRILYFGVWDAKVSVSNESVLSAYDENVNDNFLTEWYEKLYGIKVSTWYDRDASKQLNRERLITLVENREPLQHIMVMLDVLKLPEREREFNKAHGPHCVMLGPTADPELWLMYDPDYHWEGVVEKSLILDAVIQTTQAGGYLLSENNAYPASCQHINQYFNECFVAERNPLNDAIREIVVAHTKGKNSSGNLLDRCQLNSALEELPLIASRKYAFEHGFAFFWGELLLPEEELKHWHEEIDKLTRNYKKIHLAATEYALNGQPEIKEKIISLIDQQDATDLTIKQGLKAVHDQWHKKFIIECSLPKNLEVPA